jgi:cobalt-zinc-cadmium efflux system outer membrane protein
VLATIRMRRLAKSFSYLRILLVGSVTFVFLCVPPGNSPAQETPTDVTIHRDTPRSWSLAELIEFAEANSPDLRRAAAEVEVQRGRAWQAGLYPNPQIQGGSTQLGGSDSQYFAVLSQEIVTKHKLQLDRAAVCLEVQQAELQFVRMRFDLLTSVRQSFYATLAAQQRLVALRDLRAVTQRSANVAKSLENSGEGTRGDTLLLELEMDRADFGTQNASTSVEAVQRQLAAVVGSPELVIEHVRGDLGVSLPNYSYHLARAGVLGRNAQIQSAQIEVERNRTLLERARVEPFPNVTVQAGYMYQVTFPNDMAMLQLNVPIPTWNKNQGGIHAAQASVSRATEGVRKTQNDLQRQLAVASGRYSMAQQQVSKYEQSILPKARQSVELSEKGFKTGQFDFLRVLQSQRALIESELNYLTAQENRWVSGAEIAGLVQDEEFPPKFQQLQPPEPNE